MGLFFKKSKKLGLFRLNFSKSGIGVSFGVKGFRVSTNSKRTQVNIGANGVYYRKSISNKKIKNAIEQNNEFNENISQTLKQEKPILYVYRTKELENYQGFTGLFVFLSIVGVVCLFAKQYILSIVLIPLGLILLHNYKKKHADIKIIADEQQKEVSKYITSCEVKYIRSDKNEIVLEESPEQKHRRTENKYKDYNYSHEARKEL